MSKDEQEKIFLNAYCSYNKDINRHIKYRVHSQDAADDLTQETFFRLWKYLNSKKHINNVRGFLYTTAQRVIIDYYRKRSKAPAYLEEVPLKILLSGPSQENETEWKIKFKLFQKYLLELARDRQKIIIYRFFKGYTINEICQLTGKSPNQISVAIYHGVKEIKEKMGPELN